jgi:hypothetical protein
MNHTVHTAGAVALIFVAIQPVPALARGGESDAAIRQKIIQASIAEYPGNCPCPYNTDRAGRSCGRRSAYSRPGGYAPKCYPADVSEAEVRAFRAGR